jgi:hypothetical protein
MPHAFRSDAASAKLFRSELTVPFKRRCVDDLAAALCPAAFIATACRAKNWTPLRLSSFQRTRVGPLSTGWL